MIYEKLHNCPITQSSTNILVPFIDSDKDSWYKRYGGYHTGVDIEATSVYCLCAGIITYVGYDTEDLNVVTVQFNVNTTFRFANLKSVNVVEGRTIEQDELIGEADGFVHFELLTRELSKWQVRIGHEDHWKHDPITYARGEVDMTVSVEYSIWQDVCDQIDLQVDYGFFAKVINGDHQFKIVSYIGNGSTVFEDKFNMRIVPKEVSYICIPESYKWKNLSGSQLVGYMAVVVDDTNGTNSYCVIGDTCSDRTWSYISYKCAQELGILTSAGTTPKHSFRVYVDMRDCPDWQGGAPTIYG